MPVRRFHLKRAEQIRTALERGEAASAVMKDDATVIPVSSIRKVSYDRHDEDIDIAYELGKESDTRNIAFDSPTERDDFAVQIAAGAEAEISGRRAGLKHMFYWAIDVVGPIGVLVVGGLVLALTAWVLVRRVERPPIMHPLTPHGR